MQSAPKIERILLADDSKLCRELLKDDLAGEGVTVLEAADGQEALDLVARTPPDLILLDMQMPVRSGLGVLQELQQNEDTRRIPVIMLTGHGNQAVAVEAMKQGAKDYLVKGSVTPENLRHAITNAVQKAALEHELSQKREELRHFASIASHDLQTPLGAILDHCGTLRAECQGRVGPRAEAAIDAVAGTAQRMWQLLDSLLEYVRAGRGVDDIEPVDLGEVFAIVQANLKHILDEAGARVELGALPTVPGHRAALVQLFQNLLDNAVKFRSPQPPRVWVSAEEDGGMWHVAVRDNGMGVDPKDHDRLLAPVAGREASGGCAGSGVGLAACSAIVQRHLGHLWIDSAPGRGSTFHVMLPAAE